MLNKKQDLDGCKYVIWGAGKIGISASKYFASRNVLFFVDSDEKKWNTKINGIEVCDPDYIKNLDKDVEIIIAVKDFKEIANKLWTKYGVYTAKVFDLNSISISTQICDVDYENMISISFQGGLGNQMFQYALYRAMQFYHKNVYANFKSLKKGSASQLLRTFTNISIKEASDLNEYELLKITNRKFLFNRGDKFLCFNECLDEGIAKCAEKNLLEITSGIVRGLFQTSYFASLCEKELRKDFTFNTNIEQSLDKFLREIPETAVSVHVRRGDYLEGDNVRLYGGICTERYYKNAIKYIKSRVENPVFYFLSNDIDYVKKHYDISNAIFVSSELFSDYQDWYDMLIMSKCSHNIIANSTFSWWGAWLNDNADKIVIAPSKWINVYNYLDIYPDEWIKMDG